MKIWGYISRNYAILSTFLLFILGYPLINLVNFYQNDDPYYYLNVERFLNFNFTLHPDTAPTFYSQGFFGTFWSIIFGISTLPVLTLIISVLNFYVFVKILEVKFSFTKVTNILIGLILYTNFLHTYSSIGFMTDNYLLLFILVAVYFFEKFEKLGKNIYLHLSNIFSLASFLVKQNSLVFLVATCVYYLIKREFKKLYIQLSYLISITFFYYFIFPQTNEMRDKSFSFNKIINFDVSFSLVYAILIITSFFTLPLIFVSVINFLKQHVFEKLEIKKLLLFILIGTSSFILLNTYFKIGTLSFQEFPYFENTFERTGFYPRTIHGTKYQFRFNYDFYYYADLVSKIFVSLTISLVFLNFKRSINIYSVTLFGLFFLSLFISSFFDRYILFFLPFAILFLLNFYKNTLLSKLVIAGFVIYQSYFSYFFSSDFVLSHNYIWSKSLEISQNQGVSPSDIFATSAWGDVYGKSPLSPFYLFSYDSININDEIKQKFELVEAKNIDTFGSLFINPKIYLYKLKSE